MVYLFISINNNRTGSYILFISYYYNYSKIYNYYAPPSPNTIVRLNYYMISILSTEIYRHHHSEENLERWCLINIKTGVGGYFSNDDISICSVGGLWPISNILYHSKMGNITASTTESENGVDCWILVEFCWLTREFLRLAL